MNQSNDKIIDRIESAERMLRQARTEHSRGNAEDAVTFLEVAGTRIKAAVEAIDAAGKNKPVNFSERKEATHAR